MSIKNKTNGPPPKGDSWPPYAEDTPCWGCERLYDQCALLVINHGLCDKCAKILRKPS